MYMRERKIKPLSGVIWSSIKYVKIEKNAEDWLAMQFFKFILKCYQPNIELKIKEEWCNETFNAVLWYKLTAKRRMAESIN